MLEVGQVGEVADHGQTAHGEVEHLEAEEGHQVPRVALREGMERADECSTMDSQVVFIKQIRITCEYS